MNKRTLTLKSPITQGVKIDDVVNRNCENCRFFDWQDMLCKHRAPYLGQDGKGNWPAVTVKDWCGQFKRLAF